MKSAVIVFPGSNCDRDAATALKDMTGKTPAMVWHQDSELPEVDLVVLPGGFAYGEFRDGFTQSSAIQTGWTAGGGVEWMFMPNWSAKLEYLYSDISGGNNNGFNAGIGINNVNNHTRWNTVRAGVSYHFNFGAPAPVLAKY